MSERKQFWFEHLERIDAEGMTAKRYAEREGLSVSALYSWRQRWKAERVQSSGDSETQRRFTRVHIAGAAPSSVCTLTLASGVRLELAEWPAPQWLSAVVLALSGTAC